MKSHAEKHTVHYNLTYILHLAYPVIALEITFFSQETTNW